MKKLCPASRDPGRREIVNWKQEIGKAELEHRSACHSEPAAAVEESRAEALALDLEHSGKSPTSKAQSEIPLRQITARDDSEGRNNRDRGK